MTSNMFSCAAGVRLLVLLVLIGAGGCLPAGQGTTGLNRQVTGQDAAVGDQGLSVVYVDGFFRNIDQMPSGAAADRQGRRGAPVLLLDHRAGRKGEVFASGRSRGVGLILQGYLDLSVPGVYRFRALANDGIRMSIAGRRIFEDPAVHGDRLTPVGEFRVSAPGRFPVTILYFQRKGTSALRLYWQPPGSDTFTRKRSQAAHLCTVAFVRIEGLWRTNAPAQICTTCERLQL